MRAFDILRVHRNLALSLRVELNPPFSRIPDFLQPPLRPVLVELFYLLKQKSVRNHILNLVFTKGACKTCESISILPVILQKARVVEYLRVVTWISSCRILYGHLWCWILHSNINELLFCFAIADEILSHAVLIVQSPEKFLGQLQLGILFNDENRKEEEGVLLPFVVELDVYLEHVVWSDLLNEICGQG